MPLTSPNFVAGGNIYPRRFVAPQAAAVYWTTGQAFVPGDIKTYPDANGTVQLYVCVVAHTSNTWATDLAAGDWVLFSPAISSRTSWYTSTAYSVGQVVNYQATIGSTNPQLYICIKAVTSSSTYYASTLANQLSDGNWQLFDDIGGGAYSVVQAKGVAQRILGVSMEGTDYPPYNDPRITVPGYAAIQGEELQVYGPGEICKILLGGTVLFGSTLTSDANGKGVAITPANSGTINFVGGIALEPGVSGECVDMLVQLGTTLV